MKIYFENSYGERRLLAERDNQDGVWQVISNFLAQHKYRARYIRSWTDDEGTWYDVGSWSELFLVADK